MLVWLICVGRLMSTAAMGLVLLTLRKFRYIHSNHTMMYGLLAAGSHRFPFIETSLDESLRLVSSVALRVSLLLLIKE